MNRYRKFLIGGGVIAVALAGLVVAGLRESFVYFVTPSELRAGGGQAAGKAYRLGGMVVQGSLRKELTTLDHDFLLTDGKATVPVHFRGTPPDLFAEGRGAVVEGTVRPDGTFLATTIMAKHSEEYKAPHDPQAGYQELLRTLREDGAPTTKPGPVRPPG